jgi:hypothetical protein
MECLFEDVTDVHGIARMIQVTVRTVNRYSAMPDGMPYIVLGRRRLYHIPSVREWLLNRMITPNPRRKA